MTSKKIPPLKPKIETIIQPPPQQPTGTTVRNSESAWKTLIIACSIMIAGGLIGLSIFLASVYNARSNTTTTATAKTERGQVAGQQQEPDYQTLAQHTAPVTAADHIRGSKEAKVMLVEYSDLDCPFCKQVHPTLKKIYEEYNGQVAWVYRHFPLSAIHPTAERKAEAAECVGELAGNEGFWKFIDSLFSQTAATDTQLAALASSAGADTTAFESCLKSGTYKSKIAQHLDDGTRSGVSGTPHTILIANGSYKALRGALPEQNFTAEIDALLKK